MLKLKYLIGAWLYIFLAFTGCNSSETANIQAKETPPKLQIFEDYDKVAARGQAAFDKINATPPENINAFDFGLYIAFQGQPYLYQMSQLQNEINYLKKEGQTVPIDRYQKLDPLLKEHAKNTYEIAYLKPFYILSSKTDHSISGALITSLKTDLYIEYKKYHGLSLPITDTEKLNYRKDYVAYTLIANTAKVISIIDETIPFVIEKLEIDYDDAEYKRFLNLMVSYHLSSQEQLIAEGHDIDKLRVKLPYIDTYKFTLPNHISRPEDKAIIAKFLEPYRFNSFKIRRDPKPYEIKEHTLEELYSKYLKSDTPAK